MIPVATTWLMQRTDKTNLGPSAAAPTTATTATTTTTTTTATLYYRHCLYYELQVLLVVLQ